MGATTADIRDDRAALDDILAALRPKLHRYCARMTGSVIDGEDVVQEALLKAIEAIPKAEPVANAERWLFRIAHNAALDFLRRRGRQDAIRSEEDPEMVLDSADPATVAEDHQTAATSLHTFMRLPTVQRSAVILMDVLGYPLAEIGVVMNSSIPAVKSALHRGRSRLRELAKEPDDRPLPMLPEADRARLAAYVERFNARDFDAIRGMLAEDMRLDLVARLQANGRAEVGNYLHNYASKHDWIFEPGIVEGHPAAIVRDPADPSGTPTYFILLAWSGKQVLTIRDFRYARYAVPDAHLDEPRTGLGPPSRQPTSVDPGD